MIKRDWFTATEVAAMFAVTPQSVRLWIVTGQLDGDQAAKGTWLIHESAIESFTAQRHSDDTPSPTRRGRTKIRPAVRRSIDPAKRYRLPTGEVVTGAEILRRRGQCL